MRYEYDGIYVEVTDGLEHQYWCRKTFQISGPNHQSLTLDKGKAEFLLKVLRESLKNDSVG